jgi:hypothetical protein
MEILSNKFVRCANNENALGNILIFGANCRQIKFNIKLLD